MGRINIPFSQLVQLVSKDASEIGPVPVHVML